MWINMKHKNPQNAVIVRFHGLVIYREISRTTKKVWILVWTFLKVHKGCVPIRRALTLFVCDGRVDIKCGLDISVAELSL